MRFIYLKIFVWFWIAMSVVGLTFGFVVANTQKDSLINPWRLEIASRLPLEAERVAQLYENQGPEILEEIGSSAGYSGPGRVDLYLFDASGRELSSRASSPELHTLISQALEVHKVQFPVSARDRSAAVRVKGPSGKSYVYAAVFTPIEGPPPPLTGSFGPQAIRIAAVVAVSGIVCFWLARYISSPVSQLRSAARLLASGELSARVPLPVCRRSDELGDLGIDFNAMAERIQTLLESQRRLIRDVSHELRSPLARLRVALDLAEERTDPQPNRALQRIEIEADNINKLVGNLLHLSRLNNLSGPPDKEELDLAELLNNVISETNFEAEQAGRRVLLRRGESALLLGNEQLLHSVFQNLIRNAIRYSPENASVEIALAKKQQGSSEYTVVTVSDHGPGVPESHLADIFEPFFRVEASRNAEEGGTGLGLAIAKRAVLLHNGTIRAENLAEGGFRIEVRLPGRPKPSATTITNVGLVHSPTTRA
jgi:two-component system, OmpR family, sensor histidine kinase CpxA